MPQSPLISSAPSTASRRSDNLDLISWRRWKRSGCPRQHARLVESFMSTVASIVARRARTLPAHIDRDDLTSVGYVALLGALDSYDPAHGAPLGAWIAARVSGSLIDELRRESHLPRRVVDTQKLVARAADRLACRNGRPATREQIAAELGMTVCELRAHEAEMLRGMVDSLDRDVQVGENTAPLVDLVMSGDRDCDPVWRFDSTQTQRNVQRALNTLNHQERVIYDALYERGCDYRQAAQTLGVSPSRVGQINTVMRSKLRQRLADEQPLAA